MKTIRCVDMTLRESGAAREGGLTFKEKLEIARSLDRLKVDEIELPPLSGSKADELTNKTISGLVNTGVSATVDIVEGNIEETWESIRSAKKPSVNIVAPVSPVSMEYTCHKKAPAMLEMIADQVSKARFFCETVEFTAADATRAEEDFLINAVGTAIKAGAGRITVCDTAGVMLPDEFGAFVRSLTEKIPSLSEKELFVQVSDEMNMAMASAAAAIKAGASGVKLTVLAAGYPTLEQFSRFLRIKGEDLGFSSNIRTTELSRAANQLNWMLAPKTKEESPFTNFSVGETAENVCLDQNDEIGEVIKVVRQMGYDLSEEDNAKVFEAFRRVVTKKHFVGTRELDAIIASTALQVPATYRIENYVINSGNVITATANILLDKGGEKVRGIAFGDGPIDAAFLAIEQIIGQHYEMDDFQIAAVTQNREAMGDALVKLRHGGKVYAGKGISTDIIGAAIRAYLNALNKIAYEEKTV